MVLLYLSFLLYYVKMSRRGDSMELYQKPRFFRRRNNKKTLIIIAIAVAVILTTVTVVVAITLGKDKTPSQGGKVENTVYDTNLTGDATVDPENVEVEEEEGTNVDAEELTEENGRSNGIEERISLLCQS